MRDEGKLIPGTMYRITDYECSTSQEGTRSAGHQFDIIVQAISENVLSEDAKAIQSSVVLSSEIAFIRLYENDTISKAHFYIEDTGSFVWIDFDGTWGDIYAKSSKLSVGDKVYYTPSYDNEAGEVVSVVDYFADSNLAAWKLKYCLDNDENRFTWAKNLYLSPVSHNKCIRVGDNNEGESYIYVRQSQLDNENGLAWVYDNNGFDVSIKDYANSTNENLEISDIIYTQSENIYIDQSLDMSGTSVTVIDFSEQGSGVIYQMIDEFNNECPYDFKNIQFLRDNHWFDDNGGWTARVFTDTIFEDYYAYNHYYYTFSYINEDFQTQDASIKEGNKINKVYNNIIKCCNYQELKQLNNIIIVTTYVVFENAIRAIITNNFFDYNCHDISLGNNIYNNKIESECSNLIIAGEIFSNILYCSTYLNIVSDIYNCEFRNIENITIGGETTFTKCTFDSTVSGQEINDGESHNDCIVLYNGDDVIIKKIYEDLSGT